MQFGPFLLAPSGKDYLWDGRRLKDEYGKAMDVTPLTDVLKEHPKFLGAHCRGRGDLPILIKLIGAKEDLSVQVHPTDEYAGEHENGSSGRRRCGMCSTPPGAANWSTV